jgi:hypothetical protein
MNIESPKKIELYAMGLECLLTKLKSEIILTEDDPILYGIKSNQIDETEDLLKDTNVVLIRKQYQQKRQAS